jgi:adenylosuccinate lyase
VIERYTLPEMAAIWADERRWQVFQEVEALATEAWEKLGVVPAGVADRIRHAPTPTPAAIAEREQITHHDLAAFVDLLADGVGDGGEWVHYGLTSSDVIDTAQGSIMSEAADEMITVVAELLAVVKDRAREHAETVMVGRTHGIWAEPTSFGLKLAGWAFEVERALKRLEQTRHAVAVGKISGAVGTYAHVPVEVEAHVCDGLGIEPEPASTQVTARDRHAEYLTTLALLGSSLERFATEIRHLQRSEVGEVREAFASGQKGSSAMPHKKNPVKSENVTGLARLLRGYAQVGMENVALWHERDISHSAPERVVLPDASKVAHFAVVRLTKVIADLVVDVDRMRANLTATNGLVYSQKVLLELVSTGMGRDDAYRLVQTNAMKTWEDGTQLLDNLLEDPEVVLSDGELAACFDPMAFLANAEVVWERLSEL